jgi:glycosyltransferase involved in cell wall biosynthesis
MKTGSSLDGLRIAVCHEWITTFGGSEQVASRLADVLDAQDIFTFTARPQLARDLFRGRRVQELPRGQSDRAREHWQRFLPMMPGAWAALDLSGFDVVVTSSHSCVNAIRTAAVHISYCHTPMRYAWEWRGELGRVPRAVRPAWPAGAAFLRRADRWWSRSVDVFVANSQTVARRIESAYGRPSHVVYPPVDTSYWTPSSDQTPEDYFLLAGRLVAYKRPEVAVKAAELAGVPLVIAGDGPLLEPLRRTAGPSVRFVRSPSHDELRQLYRAARALVCPGVEDFGMTMVEAQACGTPVLAYGEGGATEAVADGLSGRLYPTPSFQALAAEMLRLKDRFDPTAVRAQAERFDRSSFDAAIRQIVGDAAAARMGMRSMAAPV